MCIYEWASNVHSTGRYLNYREISSCKVEMLDVDVEVFSFSSRQDLILVLNIHRGGHLEN